VAWDKYEEVFDLGLREDLGSLLFYLRADWSFICIILYHISMHFINKNRIFSGYLSYFSGPLLNGEEGQNLRFFKDLKELLKAQIKEVQFCNEPGDILMVLEAPAGHLHNNRTSEQSLAQRPRFCRGNVALTNL